MTDQPQPPLGNHPPPPPGSGGYPPPPQSGDGYSQSPLSDGGSSSLVIDRPVADGAVGGLPPSAYTPWVTRVVAAVLDYLPFLLIVAIGYAIEMATQETICLGDGATDDICLTGNSSLGVAALLTSALIATIYLLWNYLYRQGATGSSVGKEIMKFKVVSEKTGQPIGFALTFVRQLAHALDSLACFVGYLFPLWDAKRQTFADKIMNTICVPR